MNEILFFCEQCGFRVPAQDMESGAAKALEDNRAICCRCLPPSQRRTSARAKPKIRDSGPANRKSSPQITPVTNLNAAPAPAPPAPASRSTGHLPRMTPGHGTAPLTGSGTASRSTSHTHAVHPRPTEARPTAPSNTYLYVGMAILGAAALIGIVVALSSHSSDRPTPSQTASSSSNAGRTDTSSSGHSTTSTTSTDPTPTPTPTPRPSGGTRNESADRALEQARAFAREKPSDTDGYFYELLRLVRMYPGSTAAIEAAKMQEALPFPIGELAPPLPEWYEGWTFTPNRDKTVPRFSLDGRYAVIETHPSSSTQARFLKMPLKIDAKRPYLEFQVRGDAGQRCQVGIKPGNRNLLNVPVDGTAWKQVSIDCSAKAGEEITFVLAHRPGSSGNETVYWTPPRWRAKASPDALVAALTTPTKRPAPTLPTDTAWSKAINLLSQARPAEDAILGQWTTEGSDLISDRTAYARIALPYRPPEEYDFRVRFTRKEGSNAVLLLLAHGGTLFDLQIAGWANKFAGFEHVDGETANNNLSTVENSIETGREYTTIVQVRRDGLWLYLDGNLLTQLPTDYGNVSPETFWLLGSKKGQLGLGSYESAVAFHSADVLEVSGPGLRLRDATTPVPEAPQVVDLIANVDLAKDKIDGIWIQRNDGLFVEADKNRSRVVFPYLPPEEYDFIVSVTLPEKHGQLCQVLSQGTHTLEFMTITDVSDRVRCGYEQFDGKSLSDGPALVSGKPQLQIGQRYTFVTQVRKNSLRTYLDGELLASYTTDFSNAGMHPKWSVGEKGQGRLGLGVMGAPYLFHEVKVIEINRRGRIDRSTATSVAQPDTPTTTPTIPTTTAPTTTTQAPADQSARQTWAIFLDTLTGHLARNNNEAAINCAGAALSNPSLSTLKSSVELDVALAKAAADVEQATLKGLALLTDNRTFTLERKEGKPLTVGQGNRSRILKTNGPTCEVEEDIGGGKVVVKMSLNDFTEPTHIALARLVLTDQPADQIKLLVPQVARYVPGGTTVDPAILKRRLDQVGKDEELQPQVQRLRQWMEQKDRESAFELAYTQVVATIGEKAYEPAKTALENLKKSFFDTAIYASSGKRIKELEDSVKALDVKPGAWAMFYNKKDLNTPLVSEEVTKLEEDYKQDSPRPGVDRDNFVVRVRGLFVIEQAGRYEFQVRGDDQVTLYVEGKKLCSDNNKGDQTGAIDLDVGNRSFGIVSTENGGSAYWRVKWKKPGDADFSTIPLSAIRYDPRKKSEYEMRE